MTQDHGIRHDDPRWAQARAAVQAGQIKQAEALCLAILEQDGESAARLHQCATLLAAGNDLLLALVLTQRACKLAPGALPPWALAGQLHARLGQWPEAETALRRALQMAPDEAALHINLANVLKQQHQFDAAQAALERALRLSPDNALAHYNMGNLLRDRHQPQQALQHFETALSAAPQHADIRYNRACVLFELDQLDAARAAFEQLLRDTPQHARAWHNLGNTWRALGQVDAARDCYQRALQVEALPVTPYALGTLDMLCGRWAEGWVGYEQRWTATGKPRPATHLPPWQGQPVPPASRLLVLPEQGLGDQMQFARFLPLLLQHFATVCVLVPPPLLRLLQQSLTQPGLQFVGQAPEASGFDFHIPLMSLGAALQIDSTTIAAHAQPYLRAATPPAQTASANMQIGLAWCGNPAQPDNRLRSIETALLQPLLHLEGMHWHSLLYQHPEPLPPGVSDATTHWRDMADAADTVLGLDLIITVCTATAHLAGALGKPVWLLSRFDADWRWQRAGADCAWYPSMRIFRQHAPRDWHGVIAEVALALEMRQALQAHAKAAR